MSNRYTAISNNTHARLRRSLVCGLAALLTCYMAGSASAAEPQWTLSTPAGETVSFPDEQAGPTVLLFWASWCPYCKQLMPYLQAIKEDYAAPGVQIYAIHFRDDADPQAYMDANGYTFTVLEDGANVAEQYGVYGTPGLLIFDSNQQRVFNLYDVVTDVDKELAAAEGLSHGEKAARKAPAWAERIRAALDEIT